MNGVLAASLGLFCVLLPQASWGQEADYVVRFSDVLGASGSQQTVTCFFDHPTGPDINGWQLAVCHDNALLTPLSAENGSTTQTVRDGAPPDLGFIEIIPGIGVTMGVIISMVPGEAVLPPGSEYELLEIIYSLNGPNDTLTELYYCSIGSPVVETLFVFNLGQELAYPTTVPGSVEITLPFFFNAASVEGVAAQQVSAAITMENPMNVYGFSFGLAHDGAIALLEDIQPGAATREAEFFVFNLTPEGGTGGILGCILDTDGPGPLDFIPNGVDQEIALFQYEIVPGAAVGEISPLAFTDELSPPAPSPPTPVVVSIGETAVSPITLDGSIEVVAEGTLFERGDTNSDGTVNIADSIFLFEYLFVVGAPEPQCFQTGDINNDEGLNVADGIYLLTYLFSEGPPPPAPFEECGLDPTPGPLSCNTNPPCEP